LESVGFGLPPIGVGYGMLGIVGRRMPKLATHFDGAVSWGLGKRHGWHGIVGCNAPLRIT